MGYQAGKRQGQGILGARGKGQGVNMRGKGQGARGKENLVPRRVADHASSSVRHVPLATHHAPPCPLPLAPCPCRAWRAWRGFTLIELLVVLSIIALLLSLAVPRYFHHVDRAKEAVLRENLATLRDAVDQYHADTEQWPDSLDALVDKHYLRAVPKDPVTDSQDTWILVPPQDGASGVYDIKSGATGVGADGQSYEEW